MMRYLFILLLLPFVAQGQTTYKILADSTRLGHINNTGNELILENDTRDTLGVITNVGNGRTQFKALRLQQVTDSTFRLLLGNTAQGQTILIKGTGGGGATYTLTKNASKDSIVLTGSNGTRYAVLDSAGDATLLLDTTNVSYYTVISTLNTPPGSPAVGATYAIGNSPTGAWTGKAKNIAEWNGASWDFTAPVQGDYYYDQASGYTYQYRSGVWVRTSSIPVLVNGQSLSSGVLLGTNNSQSLTFETNNVRRSRIDSLGRFYVYNVPTSTDTFLLAYNSTGRFTKVGKSTLPNIYTTDGIIDENRIVDVQGNLTFVDTTYNNYYSFIKIGDSIPYPDGAGGFIYSDAAGASQYSLYSNNVNKTGISASSSGAFINVLANYNVTSDLVNNNSIGFISSYDTTNTSLASTIFYSNGNGEYISLDLNSGYGFSLYPYNIATGTYKQPYSFSVYDTLQNKVFGIKTDGTTEATSLSATTMKIVGTNGNGHINLKHQASDATATGSSTALFADANGDLKYKNDNLYYTTLKTSGNTANREYRFPDSTGTVALTSNVINVSSYGKNSGNDSTVLLLSNGTRYAAKDSTGGTSGWSLTGNSGLNASTNFLGTTDSVNVVFKMNNLERLKIGGIGKFEFDRPTAGLYKYLFRGSDNGSTNTLAVQNGAGTNCFVINGGIGTYFNFGINTDSPVWPFTIANKTYTASNLEAGLDFQGSGGYIVKWHLKNGFNSGKDWAISVTNPSTAGQGYSSYYLTNDNDGTQIFTITSTKNNIGIHNQTSPTAYLHIAAGTATANTAPLKITTTSAALLTVAEAGAIEVLNDTIYYTGSSANRRQLTQSLYGSATLDFGSTNAQNSADLTITVTGASDGDIVALGVPNASVNANTSYSAWVSASNTVTVRFNNYSSGSVDPASGTFKVRVIKN